MPARPRVRARLSRHPHRRSNSPRRHLLDRSHRHRRLRGLLRHDHRRWRLDPRDEGHQRQLPLPRHDLDQYRARQRDRPLPHCGRPADTRATTRCPSPSCAQATTRCSQPTSWNRSAPQSSLTLFSSSGTVLDTIHNSYFDSRAPTAHRPGAAPPEPIRHQPRRCLGCTYQVGSGGMLCDHNDWGPVGEPHQPVLLQQLRGAPRSGMGILWLQQLQHTGRRYGALGPASTPSTS